MITKVHTEFSVYELDQAEKRIRRIEGERSPTPNQGTDGSWRAYEQLTWIGLRLLVVYGIDETMTLRQTMLSEIQSIDGPAIETHSD